MPPPKPMRVSCDNVRCGQMFSQTNWKQTRCPECGPSPRPLSGKAPESGPRAQQVVWSKWLVKTLEPLIGTLTASEFNQVYRRLIMAEHKEKAA